MKLLRRLIFILVLVLAGFMVIRERADAGSSPTPSIHILNAVVVTEGPPPEAEVSGYMLNSNEQPQLTFFFLQSGDPDPIIVPKISVVWDSNFVQWTARLDLSSIPNGHYQVFVTATFEDGTTVSDTISSPVPECDMLICIPG